MNDITKKRIIVFVAVTFALTWAYEFGIVWPVAMGGFAGVPPQATQLLVAVAMFFPALGVLITRLVTKEGFRKSLIVPVQFKKTWKYWLLGWFGPAVLTAVGGTVYFLVFPGDFDPTMSAMTATLEAQAAAAGAPMDIDAATMGVIAASQLAMGVLLAPALNFLACFGEEWGWRGYLLPKMASKLSIVPTLAITGIIWGLWHAPITALGHNYGLGYAGYPFTGILAMCCFCFVVGVFLSYITLKSGSCLPAAFAHGSLNGFASAAVFFSATGGNSFVGPAPMGIIGGIGFIACAVVMVIALVRRQKRGEALLLEKAEPPAPDPATLVNPAALTSDSAE